MQLDKHQKSTEGMQNCCETVSCTVWKHRSSKTMQEIIIITNEYSVYANDHKNSTEGMQNCCETVSCMVWKHRSSKTMQEIMIITNEYSVYANDHKNSTVAYYKSQLKSLLENSCLSYYKSAWLKTRPSQYCQHCLYPPAPIQSSIGFWKCFTKAVTGCKMFCVFACSII